MSKVTIENKNGKFTIINKLSYPETVNERIYNAIASGMFEGFLPVSVLQKRKETRIECVVQGLIPLTQYFSGIVTKKMFLDFVHKVALLIKSCEENMVNANNLDLQNDRIFIDPLTKSVKCIYWPVVNNQRGNPPHLFLKQLPFDFKLDDDGCIEVYKAFFGGLNPFSVNSFERMLLKLSGKKSDAGYTTPSEALSGALYGNKKSDNREIYEKKKINIEYDPFADISDYSDAQNREREIKYDNNYAYCPYCGFKNDASANFCVRCGFKLKKEEQIDVAPLKVNNTIDFDDVVLGDVSKGTSVFGYNEIAKPLYPSLISTRTGEVYLVDKPVFRVGKEQGSCDIFIYDNSYISRIHADIVARNGRYFLVDRNSTNKTFVDGRVIPAEFEVEIFSGTRISFANEEFTFNIGPWM